MAEDGARRRHVFISYVPENSSEIDSLLPLLESAGAAIMRDDDILPGEDWLHRTRKEIADNTLIFLACFSHATATSGSSTFYTQLNIAIDQVRQRPHDETWLIPVRFDDCEIPDYDLGGGRTLASLRSADLFGSQNGPDLDNLVRIVNRTYEQHYPGSDDDRADSGPAAKSLMFAKYRSGLEQLRQMVQEGSPYFSELIADCDKLAKQLDAAEGEGDSDAMRMQRNTAIFDLDGTALDAVGQSYRELCQFGFSYADWRTVRTSLAKSLPYAEFNSTTRNHTRDFAGRAALMRRIYETVNNKADDSGYTIVTAALGFGKSAVMARLIQRERWPHHYIGDHLRSGRQILESLCAQLIRAYDLHFDDALYDSDNPCGPLYKLLEIAASERVNRPVVVVIDGLDESDELAKGTLRLPKNLPDGSFIIVTRQPPGQTGHIVAEPVREMCLVNDDENQNDLREYIDKIIGISDHDERTRIRAFGQSDAEFREQLIKRGDGNFKYVSAVLLDIRLGSIKPATLDDGALPASLIQYYHYHWNRMIALAGEVNFDRQFIPVMRLLASPATRRGPATVGWLAARSGLQKYEVMDVLNTWSQFFLREGEIVRFCHSSFREFLAKDVLAEDSATQAS